MQLYRIKPRHAAAIRSRIHLSSRRLLQDREVAEFLEPGSLVANIFTARVGRGSVAGMMYSSKEYIYIYIYIYYVYMIHV